MPEGEVEDGDRLCDSLLDSFESDHVATRAAASRLCGRCPLMGLCRAQTRGEILSGRGPVGVVRAGVVWDDDGKPDARVHGAERDVPDWVPPRIYAVRQPDVDEYLVELAITDPERVRGTTFTEAERDAVIQRAAETGRSMHWIRTTLSLHPRKVSAAVIRLGLREHFAPPRRTAC